MDRGIWILAAWLVTKHGAQAPYAVHARIMEMRRARVEDELIALWILVDDAVRAWVRSSPSAVESVH